jgi:NAD(P)-dependent dehydrogenase (short-subunit alcohol dehydrogenase family)
MSIFDKFSLRGKVAIVTGGNRGIGKAIALGFAEAGAAVAVVARDEKKSEETLAELRDRGGKAIAVTANVAQRSDLEAMLVTVTDELGPVDVLVNNAGIGFHADALTLDDSDWRRVFDTNLDAVWMASQIVGRQMVARKAGSIPQWHSAYGISKAAVHHLTKSLAAEWASKGVRVNAIAPGYVKTEIANKEYDDYRHYWCDEVPMQRYATPDEIAPIALLLASDAGSFITGSVFVVDGGYTLW